MNLHQFQTLLPQFERSSDKFERRRKRTIVVTGQKRQRQISGGAQFAHDLSDRAAFVAPHTIGSISPMS